MSTCESPQPNGPDNRQAPPGYRPVENYNLLGQWVHESTGLAVELHRFSVPTQMQNPITARRNCYKYKLVIRPDGTGGSGVCVDETKDRDHSRVMAEEWMEAHPGGEAEL